VVRDHEDRLVKGRIIAPPPGPGVVAPRPSARRAELPASHDLGPDVGVLLRHDRTAGVLLAAFHAVGLAPGLQPDGPVMKLLTALAEGFLLRLVGAGDVAIK
jgi:hypothetical protein